MGKITKRIDKWIFWGWFVGGNVAIFVVTFLLASWLPLGSKEIFFVTGIFFMLVYTLYLVVIKRTLK